MSDPTTDPEEQNAPQRPEWAPSGAGSEFAGFVSPGVAQSAQTRRRRAKRRELSLADYVEGIRNRDHTILARAITLVESSAPRHIALGQELLAELMAETGGSIRVGITGVPGAGKSTFIEALGSYLCEQDQRVAVLAIDPSSSVSRGSILGDKTRMEKLGQHPNAFIRPSPSAGTLGGVTRKSRETILLCEAFGYETILVETVGVGQSETTVRSMVDFFLLVLIAGAGDELQGIKKGVIELADMILINKADGDNVQRARMARQEYARVLQFLSPATPGWKTKARTCSAMSGAGIDRAWETVLDFVEKARANGVFGSRRAEQRIAWMRSMIDDTMQARFYGDPATQALLKQIEPEVAAGSKPATAAVHELMASFWKGV